MSPTAFTTEESNTSSDMTVSMMTNRAGIPNGSLKSFNDWHNLEKILGKSALWVQYAPGMKRFAVGNAIRASIRENQSEQIGSWHSVTVIRSTRDGTGLRRPRRFGVTTCSIQLTSIFSWHGDSSSGQRLHKASTAPSAKHYLWSRVTDYMESVESLDWKVVGRTSRQNQRLSQIHNASGRAYMVDEMRIGASWRSVTPMK